MDEPTADEIRSARRVSPGVRGALRPGGNHDKITGEVLPDIPSLMEAERKVLLYSDRLDSLVEDYVRLTKAEAEAQADWEEHHDRVALLVADSGKRSSQDLRKASAMAAMSTRGVMGEDLYRAWLIVKAASASCKVNVSAVQSQLSALQTSVKGLRAATGLN